MRRRAGASGWSRAEIRVSALRRSRRPVGSASPRAAGRQAHSPDWLDGLGVIAWEADARPFRHTYVSAGAERLLGYGVREWLEDADFWAARILPEDRESALTFYRAAALGKAGITDYRVTAADGRVVWLRDRVHAARGEDGRVRALRGVMVDITEFKQAELALVESRSYLQALVSHLPVVLFVVARDGRFVRSEGRGLEALGLKPGEVVGQSVFELYADHPEICEAIRRALSGERQLLTTSVGHLVYETRYFPLRGPGGEVESVLGTAMDITEHVRATEEAHRALSLLTATLDSTTDGILVVDASGRMVSFNQRFVEIWRVPDAILRSRDDDQALAYVLDQLVEPDRFLAKVRELYAQPDAESFDVLEFKDGRTVERYSLPQRLEGRSVGRVWSFRDVTERRHAEEALRLSEEELRQAQKMDAIGRLAGGVAHDFNNLLTAILGHGRMLMDRLPPDDPRHNSAAEIHRAAERAAQLTRQLLAFGRKQMLAFRVLDLDVVVAEIAPMLERLIGEDIELAVERCDHACRIRADRSQIEQVVLNLVINARDAMPQGGTLRLSTARVELDADHPDWIAGLRPGPHAILTVTDTGFGMDAETRERIFEPFFTTKERGKGIGLGLAMVYGIVAQSGGRIAVDSAPERGSRFRVYLPAAEGEVEGETPATEAGIPRGDETILLVEDETAVRDLARRSLAECGYRVLEAASGDEAMDLARRHPDEIDLLVTDVVMPKMGGRELAERLTRLKPGARVLYISGYADDAVVQHGVLEAGLAFLQKPFAQDTLARRVRQVLDAR